MKILQKNITILLTLVILLISCNKNNSKNPLPENMDYKIEMRKFVQNISVYAKNINPKFVIIPQNGANLVSTTGKETGSAEISYINAIDGIGQEDLVYGYNNDDEATPSEDKEWLEIFLNMAKNNGTVKIMVTDYCSTHYKINDSYSKNNANGYISYAANHRELDNISNYPSPIYNENTENITNLQNAKNFLYLINTDEVYPSSQAFINAVSNTNYDYIIMDLFYDGEEFTPSQIEQLKHKANGAERLVICYISIGEAENYRYYWRPYWYSGTPSFIEKENPDWEGNFIVRYWDSKWQSIIYGNNNSYIKKILDTGFDGAYLDIIDAFEYYEE